MHPHAVCPMLSKFADVTHSLHTHMCQTICYHNLATHNLVQVVCREARRSPAEGELHSILGSSNGNKIRNDNESHHLYII